MTGEAVSVAAAPEDAVPHHPVRHIFSIDVEEHFQVHSLEPYITRDAWDRQSSRVERNVDLLLELLSHAGARATFFTLGWVAERHPAMVRRIAHAGHEVASHGWSHRKVTTLRPAEFREEVRVSKRLLEDLAGQPVLGFRAPSFSIGASNLWAFDVLIEEGYRYDSSIFPIRRPGYGDPRAPWQHHVIRRPGGLLHEFPMATFPWRGLRLPVAGGGYLRHLPVGIIRRAFRSLAASGAAGVFYLHPWEVDAEQPRLNVPLLTRMRHYGGLRRTIPRVAALLEEFPFTSFANHLETCSGTSAAART